MKCLRCGPLIKAIDAYLAKAENDLYEQLTMEGYLKAKESLNTVDEIEEVVTKLLEDNADDLLKELADAIDLADASLLCEELGDVLLQVALHTRMEEEQGAFTFSILSFPPSCRRMLRLTSRKRMQSSPLRSSPSGQPIG